MQSHVQREYPKVLCRYCVVTGGRTQAWLLATSPLGCVDVGLSVVLRSPWYCKMALRSVEISRALSGSRSIQVQTLQVINQTSCSRLQATTRDGMNGAYWSPTCRRDLLSEFRLALPSSFIDTTTSCLSRLSPWMQSYSIWMGEFSTAHDPAGSFCCCR